MSLIIKSKFYNKTSNIVNDYSEAGYIKRRKEIHESGTLYRKGDKLSFKLVGALNTTDNSKENTDFVNDPELISLLSIKKNKGQNFEIDFGECSKDLIELMDENASYFLYKGFAIDNFFKDNHRYHVITQGDIIKIGKIYLKVLHVKLSKKSKKIMKTSTNNDESINNNNISKNNSKDEEGKNEQNRSAIKNNNLIIERDSSKDIIKERNLKSKLPRSNSKIAKINFGNFVNNININNSMVMTQKMNLTQLTIDLNSINDANLKNIKQSLSRKNIFNKRNKLNKNFNVKNNQITYYQNIDVKNKICRICLGGETNPSKDPLISPCICKGSMKYVHYLCIKNWLNLKIESEIGPIENIEEEKPTITYCTDDICCELCQNKLPDYVKHNGKLFNISFYKPKYTQFIVLESVRNDSRRKRYIHIIPLNKDCMFRIGRYNRCELSFLDSSISRIHCFIYLDNNNLILDNNSKYGTKVLIQKRKLNMVSGFPLCIETQNTYLKIILEKKFSLFSCCDCSTKSQTGKDPYQIQNQKGFDLFCSMVFKDNDENESENEDNPEIKENENINVINDINNEEEKKESFKSENENKIELNYVNNINETKKKDKNSDNRNLIDINLNEDLISNEITDLKNNKKDITIINENLKNKFFDNNETRDNIMYEPIKKEKQKINNSYMNKIKLNLAEEQRSLDYKKLNKDKNLDVTNIRKEIEIAKAKNKEKFNKIMNNIISNVNKDISKINNKETENQKEYLNQIKSEENKEKEKINLINNNLFNNYEEDNIRLPKSINIEKINNLSLKKVGFILGNKNNISLANKHESIFSLIPNDKNKNFLLFAPKHNKNIKFGNYEIDNENEKNKNANKIKFG